MIQVRKEKIIFYTIKLTIKNKQIDYKQTNMFGMILKRFI